MPKTARASASSSDKHKEQEVTPTDIKLDVVEDVSDVDNVDEAGDNKTAVTESSAEKVEQLSEPTPESQKEKPSTGAPKRRGAGRAVKLVFAGLFLLMLLVVSIGGTFAWHTVRTVQGLIEEARSAKDIAQQAYGAVKVQNLPEVDAQLKVLQDKLNTIKQSYVKMSYYQYIPFVGAYYMDGLHAISAADHGLKAGLKSVEAVVPYADVLGFKGEGSYTGGGTAEDRLKIILETLAKIMPIFDEITQEVAAATDDLHKINPQRYPEQLKGMPVRQYITQAQEVSKGAVTAMTEFRPAIEKIPYLAGADGKRKKYMMLFQNDNELRPTGGFLTAFAIIFVENGKVTLDKSDDIYEMDKKFTKKLPIPPVLGKYLTTEKKFNLRDMNIYPDFRASMELFTENYKSVRGEPSDFDGVIAIDTTVLTETLKVLGPVDVPGYGQFSAESPSESDVTLIAKEDDRVVGIIRFVVFDDHIRVRTLYVHPEYTGRGIGTQLWAEALRHVPVDKKIIAYPALHTKSIDWYKKMGFVETGEEVTDPEAMPISRVHLKSIKMVLDRK
jgi:ribosomal protein S18 acetylase RimI-like enzyme